MSNPTSMQMFQSDVQNDLVGGFLSYPDPEPVEDTSQDDSSDDSSDMNAEES